MPERLALARTASPADTVRELLVGVPFDHGRDVDTFFSATVPALAERGLFGMLIPERFGGAGYTVTQYVDALAVLAEHDAMAAYSVNEHSTIGSLGLVQYGDPKQQEQWLPRIARGETLAAFCLTEPKSGSDVTNLATTALPAGDAYRIDGMKVHISLAHHAGLFTVLAEIPGDDRRHKTAFLVESDRPGLRLGPHNSSPPGFLIPVAGSTIFENCVVDRDAILAEVGEGGRIFKAALEIARAGLSAVYVGASADALQRCLDWTMNRYSFGRPLTEHQSVQHHLADMSIQLEASRQLVAHAARVLDHAPDRATGPAATAKVFATEAARSIGATAVQLFGGQAFLEERPVHWYMTDAKMGEILAGTSEIMRMLIYKELARTYESSREPES